MKKIITVLSFATLCAGCSHSDESAKIDALSKKIDQLERNQCVAVTNEFVLFGEIQTLKAEVTNLPTFRQLDSMAFYYHTNALEVIQDRIDNGNLMQTEALEKDAKLQSALLDNILALEGTSAEIETAITNGTMPDVTYLHVKIDDMDDDVRSIKQKLGLY